MKLLKLVPLSLAALWVILPAVSRPKPPPTTGNDGKVLQSCLELF